MRSLPGSSRRYRTALCFRPDRCGNASTGVRLDSGAAGRGRTGQGQADRYRRDEPGSERIAIDYAPAIREYAARRGWMIALQVREVSSGEARREAREKVLEAAHRRENRLRARGSE